MIREMAGSTVAAARELAPMAAELAGESERRRSLAPELSAALADAGLYRLCVPAAVGGGEAPPAELLGAVEELGRGDGAAGWCVAVCATAGMLGAYIEPDAAAEVYGAEDAVVGGVFAPSGRADDGGHTLTVSGRWRFASNVEHCDWVMGGCVVTRDGEPSLLESGRPDIRLTLMPADRVEVIDTWTVSGLRATGSHDIAADAVEVPAGRTASLLSGGPREPGPLYAFPPFGLLASAIAAVGLGIARGALDDVAELAGAKTPTLSTRKLAERAATQSGIARAEAAVRSARALLYEAVDEAWDAARADAAIPIDLRAGLRLAATNATESAAAAVDAAWSLAGGSAIYATGPLERRFRDVHAATQHMLVGPATWELTGRSLLGLEFDSTQL